MTLCCSDVDPEFHKYLKLLNECNSEDVFQEFEEGRIRLFLALNSLRNGRFLYLYKAHIVSDLMLHRCTV